jgi:O-antigen/teichoic acid export membrane protein
VLSSFEKGMVWSFGSFVVLAVCGLLLNIFVGLFFGTGVLGVFNQAYTFYILFGQLAAWGIHHSLLKYLSEHRDNQKMSRDIIFSGMFLSLLFSFCASFLLFVLRFPLSQLLQSPEVFDALLFVAPAVFFFALNKTLLSVLNAYERMRDLAIAQSFRYVVLVACIVVFALFDVSVVYITASFLIAEVLLFVVLFTWFACSSFVSARLSFVWVKKHFLFGTKVMPSGSIAELNTRVDILILGIFSSDVVVGVYSLAATFAEGIGQLAIVLRANVNPRLTRLFVKKKFTELHAFVYRYKMIFYGVMFVVLLMSALLYPVFLHMVFPGGDFDASYVLFLVLMGGIFLASGYLPFTMIFSQLGKPLVQTGYMLFVLLVNVVLNIVLIPSFDAFGAALATSISFIFSVFLLSFFSRKYLQVQI